MPHARRAERRMGFQNELEEVTKYNGKLTS
jgi:hypothetical protein